MKGGMKEIPSLYKVDFSTEQLSEAHLQKLATVCSVLKIIDNSFQHCTVMGAKITCFGFS